MSITGQVPVPADIDIADKVLFGLTVRQVIALAPSGLAAGLLWKALGPVVPPEVAMVVAALPVVVGAVLILGRVDGLGLDRLLLAAAVMPRRPLAAGRGERAALRASGAAAGPKAGVLTGPVRAVAEDGAIDLGGAGTARAVAIGHVNFDLRDRAEQTALVAAFASLCNGIEAHLQVTVATRPVDLAVYCDDLIANAPARVSDSAREHAAWLADLVRVQQLLDRQITVTVRAQGTEAADQAAAAVTDFAAQIGVDAWLLDRVGTCERIRAGLDPYGTARRRTA